MTGRVLGVIPARLDSTRLARKVLRTICGEPMVAWVYRRAREAPGLDQVLVATDSTEVLDCCRERGIPAMLTSAAHRSGTDRIVEVMEREPAAIYVNIQGDEPMVEAGHVDLLLQPFGRATETEVSTLKVAISEEDARDPNNVKVVTDARGRALYFSRAMIPYDRDASGSVQYYKHLGLYAYTASALKAFHALPPSALEQCERLEQLRFLENGVPLAVVETTRDTIGVDTEEDLARLEEYFRHSN